MVEMALQFDGLSSWLSPSLFDSDQGMDESTSPHDAELMAMEALKMPTNVKAMVRDAAMS